MGNWALIKDDVVINTIVWEGPEIAPMDFGEGVSYEEIPDSEGNEPSSGWSFVDGIFVRPAKTPEEIAEEEEQRKKNNLNTAQWEYDRASDKITAINQQLDDEDYSDGDTEESLTAEKAVWTAYRIKLRAYIKAADGSKELPAAPSVS